MAAVHLCVSVAGMQDAAEIGQDKMEYLMRKHRPGPYYPSFCGTLQFVSLLHTMTVHSLEDLGVSGCREC